MTSVSSEPLRFYPRYKIHQ